MWDYNRAPATLRRRRTVYIMRLCIIKGGAPVVYSVRGTTSGLQDPARLNRAFLDVELSPGRVRRLRR